MRKLTLLLLVSSLLASCNTMEGIGRDVQEAGHAITGGAEEGRQQINR